jgi:hypothetical protein
MNIEITQKQAELILQFTDIAVKNYGLQIAEEAIEIRNLINMAFAKTQDKQIVNVDK